MATMFGHLFENSQSVTDLRRRALTLIDVVSERQGNGPLKPHRVVVALGVAVAYWYFFLPAFRDWGTGRWKLERHARQQRAGGPWAEVHSSLAVFVTLVYLAIVYVGVYIMERRSPVEKRVFEFMFIYNAMQVAFNAALALCLWRESWRLGFTWWGNTLDFSEEGHYLGMLLWFQFHSCQVELLDTVFVILRKKFHRMSFLHIALRLFHMWGWFFVCRFACGGDSYFPAAVNCSCQVVVYLYYAVSLVNERGVPLMRKAHVSEVQVLQFVACAAHACYVLYKGNLPRGAAAFSLFMMLTSLVLYTDFHGDHPQLGAREVEQLDQAGERLTFRFDSSAWFYIYHFGVAQWLEEHMIPEGITPEDCVTDKYPKGLAFSGASGGALVAGALASGIRIRDLYEFVLEQHPRCRYRPWLLFGAVEQAMHKFLPANCAKSMSGRVRILLTRIASRPPFITGNVVDQFQDWSDTFQGLRATIHVPGLNAFPYRYRGRYYFDGMLWSSLLVPWSGDSLDLVVKVSAVGAPLTDISAPLSPTWWMLFPPSIDELRGLFWVGYRDTAAWFAGPLDGGLCGVRCRGPMGRSGRPRRLSTAMSAMSSTISAAMSRARSPPSGRGTAMSATSSAMSASPPGSDRGMPERGAEDSDAFEDWLTTSRMRKLALARKLLLKKPKPLAQALPEFDAVTGQRVQDLLAAYRRGVDQGVQAFCTVCVASVILGIAVLWVVID